MWDHMRQYKVLFTRRGFIGDVDYYFYKVCPTCNESLARRIYGDPLWYTLGPAGTADGYRNFTIDGPNPGEFG